MATNETEKHGRAAAWAWLLVLGLAGILFLARLGERSLWSMELRWAQIPREMLRSGDWFWPTLNGRLYYDKPLGSYWLVGLTALVRGDCDETAARLPGALAGVLAVALVMVLARRLDGPATAWRAGLVLATCFSMVFFARHASADLLNLAGVLAALVLFVANAHQPTGWWLVPFWLLLALTSLTKGLLGFALPLLVIGVYQALGGAGNFWMRQRWLLNGKTLLALPLALAVYLLPFLLSSIRHGEHDGLALVFRENVQRFLAPHNHRGPIYLYAGAIWVLLAPWALLLPAALLGGVGRIANPSHEGISPGRRFALVFFWSLFLFFTLSRSRRSYYLLPILPAAALLIGQLLAQPVEALRPLTRRLLRLALAGLLLLVGLCLPAFLPIQPFLPAPWHDLPAPPAAWGGLVCGLLSLALIFAACVRFSSARLLSAFGGTSFLAAFYLFVLAAPAAEAYRDGPDFAGRVRTLVAGRAEQLALFRTREPVFYLAFDGPLTELYQAQEVDEVIRGQRLRWLVGRQRDLEAAALPGRVLTRERSFPWEPESVRQNKLVLLECVPQQTE